MSDEEIRKPKIGAGHAAAMGRQGLRELRSALYPDSNVAQQPEYGLYGTMTPGEIAADRKMDTQPQEPDQEPSVISERLQRTEGYVHAPDRETRERPLDR